MGVADMKANEACNKLWDELLADRRLKTERQLNEEGWQSTMQLAKAYGISPQHTSDVLRQKIEQGLAESTKGKMSTGHVAVFYRPKAQS